jgi:hypothetical protein
MPSESNGQQRKLSQVIRKKHGNMRATMIFAGRLENERKERKFSMTKHFKVFSLQLLTDDFTSFPFCLKLLSRDK